jgi:hypothetical protein
MKRYLSIIISLITLMPIVFSFTSCRNVGRGAVSDTIPKPLENKKDDDGDETIPKLQGNEQDNSDLIKFLKTQGRPYDEIRAFKQLEKETSYLSKDIGQIVWVPGHYKYKVDGIGYDGWQTVNGCAIWAVRRLLRHMILSGKYSHILQDAWYRDSDFKIRQLIGDWAHVYTPSTDNERDARGTGPIVPPFVILLLKHYEVPDILNSVYYDGSLPSIEQRMLFALAGTGPPSWFKFTSSTDYWGRVTVYIDPVS